MPKKATRPPPQSSSADVPLSRTSDDIRRFHRFDRDAPPERRVVYPVTAFLPLAVSSNGAADHHQHVQISVDVLASRGDDLVAEASTLLTEIRKSLSLISNSSGSASKAKRSGANDDNSAAGEGESRSNGGSAYALGSAAGGGEHDANQDLLAALMQTAGFASQQQQRQALLVGESSQQQLVSVSSAEVLTLTQNLSSFCYSRRNAARDFRLVDLVDGSIDASAAPVLARNNTKTAAAANKAAAAATGATNYDLATVVKMCQTLPIRTYSARVTRVVHDIALLLAMTSPSDFEH
jgi:hypothetical protein